MNSTKGAIHFEITASNDDLKRKLAESRQAILNSGKTAEAEGAKIEGMFKRAAIGAGAFFTVQQAMSFAKQIAVVRGQFQQLEVAFETMLGSKAKANALMAQMVDTAAKTPFDLQSVAGGAKQLLAYGSASEKVNEELIMLGNIAAGLSIPLGDMVYLYGTTQTQGRLYTQDMRQFMGRGIPLAEELAKQLGKTKQEITAMVTAGKIGFPEVQKALQSMTGEGGKFHNLMEAQSKTITGQISNLGDAIDVMFNKIGQSQEGIISSVIGGTTYVVENYEAIGREIGALVAAYGAYKAAIITTSAIQNTINDVRYSAEIAELTKLLPIKEASKNADIAAAVASGRLSESKAAQVIALRAEIGAKIQSLTATKLQADAEYASAAANHMAALQRNILAKQNMALAQSQMQVAIKSGTVEEIAIAQKNAQTASLEVNNAALAKNTTGKTLSAAASGKKAAAGALDTLQTGVNTASQNTNAVSTNILTIAKTRLAAASKALGLSKLANPYVLAAAVVAILAYGIYKLITAKSAEELAIERVNKALDDYTQKQDELKSKAEESIRTINDEVSTTYSKQKAYESLVATYPELFKKYTEEQIKMMMLTDAGKELVKVLNEIRGERDKTNIQEGYDKALTDIRRITDEMEQLSPSMGAGAYAAQYLILSIQLKKAESDLDEWRKRLEDYKRTEAAAAPPEVKIASLQKNIDELKQQNKEIDKLIESARKKRESEPWAFVPYDESEAFYQGQRQSNLKTIKSEQGQIKTLQGGKLGKGDTKTADALKKLNQDILDDQFKLESERLSIMDDGRKKRLTQSDLENREKKAALKKEYDDTVAEYKKLEKAVPKEVTTIYNNRVAEADNAKTVRDTGINEDADKELKSRQESLTAVYMTEESKRLAAIKERYDKEREWADEQFKGGNMTAEQRDAYKSDAGKAQQHEELDSLLKQYQTYADKRKEIEKKFNGDRVAIENSSLSTEAKLAAIEMLETKRKASIQSINDDEAASMQESSGLLVSLFEDASNKSVSEILKTTDTVEQLMSYLANTKNEDITPQFGFTAEQLKVLKESPKDLEAIRGGVERLNDEAVRKNPFATLVKNLKDVFSAGENDDTTEKKLAKLGESASASANMIGNIAGELSGMFEAMGNDELAGAMNTAQGVMSAVSNIGEGFAKGGLVGGTGAAIGEIAKGISALFKAGDKRKEKEIQRLQEQVDALQASYDTLGEAVEKAYSTDASKMIGQQNEMLKQQKVLIQNQMAEEQSKKDVDDEKIKQYQDQLDAIDKTIEGNKEKAIDAIFGEDLKSAIENFATAYTDAWAKGEDKAESAKDTVKKMMRQMVTESIKAAIQSSGAMEKIRKKLEEFYADNVLTGWEQDYIYNMADSLQKDLDRQFGWADSLMKDEVPEEEREASSKGIASMSQDSADELNGRFTAMQGMLFDMKNNQVQMLDLQRLHLPNLQYLAQLSHLSTISENTAYCRRLEGIENDMRVVKGELQTMNLKGLIIRK